MRDGKGADGWVPTVYLRALASGAPPWRGGTGRGVLIASARLYDEYMLLHDPARRTLPAGTRVEIRGEAADDQGNKFSIVHTQLGDGAVRSEAIVDTLPEVVEAGEAGAPFAAENPYAWVLYNPAWLPPGVPFDPRNPKHAAARAAWPNYAQGAGTGKVEPDLFNDGDLGWYLDSTMPQRGAAYTGEYAALPEITARVRP